jgi:hypothetical protein
LNSIPVTTLNTISYAIHAICVIALGILTVRHPQLMTVLLVVGGLIGLASVSTATHRHIPLFVAFGLMLTPAFWLAVAAVNGRMYLGLIPAVLLVIGVAWTLQQPGWIPAAFSAVAVVFLLAICRLAYVNRFQNDFSTPEQVVRSVEVNSVFVILSLAELLIGVAIATATPQKKKRRKKGATQVAVATEE